ncbi:hypothetical protein ONZ45_g8162 [Pleurotus djamor]|nr:hypothetical protein ONZ45_g8162 [Pleurotus djamor]
MFQVALGIEYLHKNQILHGDIKPENILIAKDADQVKAVVAGFGKSTVQNHPGYTTELAPSFLYTAPELMDYIGLAVGTVQSQLAHDEFGDVLLTPAADIYAFGLTILTVISGKRPLYQFNPFNAPFRLGYQNERPLRRDHPSSELSDILWNLICACWQVAPQARPNAPYVADVLWSDMDT